MGAPAVQRWAVCGVAHTSPRGGVSIPSTAWICPAGEGAPPHAAPVAVAVGRGRAGMGAPAVRPWAVCGEAHTASQGGVSIPVGCVERSFFWTGPGDSCEPPHPDQATPHELNDKKPKTVLRTQESAPTSHEHGITRFTPSPIVLNTEPIDKNIVTRVCRRWAPPARRMATCIGKP